MKTQQQADCEVLRAEARRVLDSDAFRGRDTLRQLLSYLVEKTINPGPEPLKEYTVGIEAFGKPGGYDPQLDASVRVQAGKLRLKLEEYYRTEGAAAESALVLPKRQFLLTLEPRTPALPSPAPEPPAARPGLARRWRWIASAALLMVAVAAILVTSRPSHAPAQAVRQEDPPLHEIWGPFQTADRPLLIVLGTMQFYRYSSGFVREPVLDMADDATRQQRLGQLAGQLRSDPLIPWPSYTGVGEAIGAFDLARFLVSSRLNPQLVPSSALTWQDIDNHNLIFVGTSKPNVFLKEFPIHAAFTITDTAIVNLAPKPGEPGRFMSVHPTGPQTPPVEAYALITSIPGLHDRGRVLAFGAVSDVALWGAVQYMTEPDGARELLARLQTKQTAPPASYQVVVHVKIKGQVPVDVHYVTHRVLNP